MGSTLIVKDFNTPAACLKSSVQRAFGDSDDGSDRIGDLLTEHGVGPNVATRPRT